MNSRIFIVVLCLTASQLVPGQQPIQQTPTTTVETVANKVVTREPVATSVTIPESEDRYRIGPGDVLDIRILNRPNLSRDSVRVEGNGMMNAFDRR